MSETGKVNRHRLSISLDSGVSHLPAGLPHCLGVLNLRLHLGVALVPRLTFNSSPFGVKSQILSLYSNLNFFFFFTLSPPASQPRTPNSSPTRHITTSSHVFFHLDRLHAISACQILAALQGSDLPPAFSEPSFQILLALRINHPGLAHCTFVLICPSAHLISPKPQLILFPPTISTLRYSLKTTCSILFLCLCVCLFLDRLLSSYLFSRLKLIALKQ